MGVREYQGTLFLTTFKYDGYYLPIFRLENAAARDIYAGRGWLFEPSAYYMQPGNVVWRQV